MRRAAVALATLLALPAAARSSIEGDGKPATQRREVPAFEKIDLETSADVNVRVGGERSVSVTIDGNLEPHLRTEVRGGVRHIRTDENLDARSPARVDVTVPALREFDLEGSGDVAIDGGAGPLQLGIEGSGDVRLEGRADALRVSVEGSGDVRWHGEAKVESVSTTGSGEVGRKD